MLQEHPRRDVIEAVQKSRDRVRRQRSRKAGVAANIGEEDADRDDRATLWRRLEAAGTHVRCLLRRTVTEGAEWQRNRPAVRRIAKLTARPAGEEAKRAAPQPWPESGEMLAA